MEQFKDNEEAEFEYEWLTREDYQFKLLVLLAVLADSKLAYRGTLADMCDFLGVARGNSRTNMKIKEAIESEESMTVSKEYVKNRLNVYANPLVKELPKHSDSANKTLAMMLDIIEKLGTKEQKPKSKLESLMDE